MNIEIGGIVIDSITALAAVVGVVVAARLGRKAVGVARETVDRSARDYAAGRVDILSDLHGDAVQRMAEFKADMHVFWKENPDKLLAEDPQSVRAKQLIEQRNDAEVAVHRTRYLLNGACIRLAKAVPSVCMDVDSTTVPPAYDVGRAHASIELFERSAMPLYYALVSSEDIFPSPMSDAVSFKEVFLDMLRLTRTPESLHAEVEKWLDKQLKSGPKDQVYPEIIAINFIEDFALSTLDTSLERLVSPILEVCRPVITIPR